MDASMLNFIVTPGRGEPPGDGPTERANVTFPGCVQPGPMG